jgi:hypothetical protein
MRFPYGTVYRSVRSGGAGCPQEITVRRLDGGEGDQPIELERISLGRAEQLTDLRFRVVK